MYLRMVELSLELETNAICTARKINEGLQAETGGLIEPFFENALFACTINLLPHTIEIRAQLYLYDCSNS